MVAFKNAVWMYEFKNVFFLNYIQHFWYQFKLNLLWLTLTYFVQCNFFHLIFVFSIIMRYQLCLSMAYFIFNLEFFIKSIKASPEAIIWDHSMRYYYALDLITWYLTIGTLKICLIIKIVWRKLLIYNYNCNHINIVNFFNCEWW